MFKIILECFFNIKTYTLHMIEEGQSRSKGSGEIRTKLTLKWKFGCSLIFYSRQKKIFLFCTLNFGSRKVENYNWDAQNSRGDCGTTFIYPHTCNPTTTKGYGRTQLRLGLNNLVTQTKFKAVTLKNQLVFEKEPSSKHVKFIFNLFYAIKGI